MDIFQGAAIATHMMAEADLKSMEKVKLTKSLEIVLWIKILIPGEISAGVSLQQHGFTNCSN